jgi:DNA-binding CsgD family transcriptional regulator
MKRSDLSLKQLRILQFTAEGLCQYEIAEIMELKLKRVEDLARGIHKKLGTVNFPASITKALERGLMKSPGIKDFPLPDLSEREKALINFIAQGVLYKQMSSKLENASTTSICKQMNILKERYEVKNVCQLIYVIHDLVRCA